MASASEIPPGIVRATSPAQFDVARELFREYAETLETDICLAGFEKELAALAQMYGPPQGGLLLALSNDHEPVGCAGIRRFDPARAELKRVYVRPAARGHGLGRALTQSAMEIAKSLGYTHMVLDTLDPMVPAQALYRSLGFKERNAYRPGDDTADPAANTLHYFERELRDI